MLRNLLIVFAAAAVAAVPFWLWRRRPAASAAGAEPATSGAKPLNRDAEPAAEDAPTATGEGAIDPDEALRRLYELALESPLRADVAPEQAKVVAAAGSALKSAATDQRYLPRRPMLLPKLLRAVSDDEASQRQIAGIISGDPALVGTLLKLANSPFYRTRGEPVESIDRAVVLLGTGGVRSLVTVALMQPLFRGSDARFSRFIDLMWEHACRAGTAAEARASTLGAADPVGAQLLALVAGLAVIVVFRVAVEQYAARPGLKPDPDAIFALLDRHAATVAQRIAKSWELPAALLEALETPEAGRPATAAASLRRSLRFGQQTGALALLVKNGALDEATALKSLAAAGVAAARADRLWAHLLR
jgi:HD-like signal output (HDOD) protein